MQQEDPFRCGIQLLPGFLVAGWMLYSIVSLDSSPR
jgi:hypothetical protein